MNSRRSGLDIYARFLGWIVMIAVVAFTAAETWFRWSSLIPHLGLLGALCVGSGLAARISEARTPGRSTRLALAFILVSAVLLPPPGAVLTTLAALLGGLGGGVAGAPGRGVVRGFAVAVAAVVAQYFHVAARLAPDTASLLAVAEILVLFVLVQGFALALGTVLAALSRFDAGPPPSDVVRGLLRETANVPLAWMLATTFDHAGWAPFAALSALILLGGVIVRELDRALTDLRDTNDTLAARVTELATLHSIGREILSSLDQDRIFPIVERECRKILDLDLFHIVLVDRDTQEMRTAYYRRRGEDPRNRRPPAAPGVASWVVSEKRGVRVDDLRADSGPFGTKPDADPETRSVLAAPLIVEDVVTGVLAVQSRRVGAYDDHQLSVLMTIAQQAAVAIENARHYEMATVDSLTGLFVREYFFRRLEEEYNRARRYRGSFCLLMMDLDAFKEINDRHGHLVGDRYLRAFGTALRARLRRADLACRYGGDEFCLLLPETDLGGAQAIAERIRVAISKLVVSVDSLTIRTTVSIGVAAFPLHDPYELRALLRKADEALYRAKKMGRDRVVPWAA